MPFKEGCCRFVELPVLLALSEHAELGRRNDGWAGMGGGGFSSILQYTASSNTYPSHYADL